MAITWPPEVEALRAEVQAWLAANLDERFADLRAVALDPDPDSLDRLRTWNALLADAGYAAVSWPMEHGGRGAGIGEQVVVAEELHRAGAPPTLNPIGLANIAPAIMQWGTDEQRRRYLRPMLRGEEIWCQGFSEPEAGSDLASLRTRAVRDGNDYVVTGQKVWTTLAHLADWCELLVRTDPEASKHRGISCLLVDMRAPGIEVRPLVTATGDREFNEIFLDEVRVPATALLGPENRGWDVAMSTLTHERAGVAALHHGLRAKVARLIDEARASGAAVHPANRRLLARSWVEAELLRLLAERAVQAALDGHPPGPESSVAKLWWGEAEQRLADVAGEVLGPAALTGVWARDRIYARAVSIAGGTTQINKSIVAQRILGLPR